MRSCPSVAADGGALGRTPPAPPLVSVVLNTFNRAGLVGRAIESVLAQSFADWELIVVDDGSEDDTPAVVGACRDPRVQLLRHANMGLCASRNAGAERARGAWVAFLDDDDAVVPEWLAALAGQTAADVGIVFCGYQCVDGEGREVGGERPPRPLGSLLQEVRGNFLPGTWLMRTALFRSSGAYLDGLPFVHQFELLVRATRACVGAGLRAVSVPGALLRYTQRPAGERPMLWPRLALDGGRWILARHAGAFARDRRWRAQLEGVVGVAAARSGRMDLARRHLLRSVFADPADWRRWLRLGAAATRGTARLAWGGGTGGEGRRPPLPLVHALPPERRRSEDHLFLPAGYRRNPQRSADLAHTPYWEEPQRNDTLYQEPVYRQAAQLIRRSRWHTVLDVGTGSGLKLKRFVLPVARDVVGFDQASAIRLARARWPGVRWVEGDLMEPEGWRELTGLRFDLVICADVVEHVEDPVALLRRIADSLAADGRLLVSTPDRLCDGRADPLGPPHNARHVREWAADEFELLLESAGLEIVGRHRFLPRGYRPTMVEAKRIVWRALHGLAIPDRRRCLAWLCRRAS